MDTVYLIRKDSFIDDFKFCGTLYKGQLYKFLFYYKERKSKII